LNQCVNIFTFTISTFPYHIQIEQIHDITNLKNQNKKTDSPIKQVNLQVTIFEHGAYFLPHPKQLNFRHQSHLM